MSARALLILLVALAPTWACSRRDCPEAEADAAQVVDPALLSFLSRARSAHRSADVHEEQQAPERALGVLESVVNGPVPNPTNPAPEVREVLADTHARLGELKSKLGDFPGAASQLEAGMRLVPEPSYFRGHLFEVRGVVEERRAEALRRQGDEAGARAAQAAALEAYETAMRIQDDVIRQSVPARER